MPDNDLWQILRWVMRRMTPEYEFAAFYFEFMPSVLGPYKGPCGGQIAPLLSALGSQALIVLRFYSYSGDGVQSCSQ